MEGVFSAVDFKALVRLALSNQHAVRLYIGLCVFERFQLDSILQISCQGFDSSPSLPRSHSDSTSSRPYLSTTTTPNRIGTSAVASHGTRLLPSHVGEFIDVVDFGHEDVAFRVFCGHLLRIPPLVQPYGSPMAALWLGAPTFLFVEATSTIPHR